MNVKFYFFAAMVASGSVNADECISPPNIEAMIAASALHHGVDPDLAAAVATVESKLDACAVSSAGAMGVMQLMPKTANDLGVTDPFDAAQNIDGGVRYLAAQIKRFRIPQLYLSAYNAGPTAVSRARKTPNYPETLKYIRLILIEYMRRCGILNQQIALAKLKLPRT